MNRDTINIDGQTYVKQGSEATPSSPPSTLKVQGARIVKGILFIVFGFFFFAGLGKFIGDKSTTTDLLMILLVLFSVISAKLLSHFITMKLFGESVMRAIPYEYDDEPFPNSSNENITSGFTYSSSADPDPSNLNRS